MDKFKNTGFVSDAQPKNRQVYGAAKDIISSTLRVLYDCTYPWRFVLPLTSVCALLACAFYAYQPDFDGDFVRLALIALYLAGEWTFYLGSGVAVLTVIAKLVRN